MHHLCLLLPGDYPRYAPGVVIDPDADPRPERGGANDYLGPVTPAYAPEDDGLPDPGEIVWVWVPYEDDPAVGKDRPVVVLGTAGPPENVGPGADYAVLMVSSRHHDESNWVCIGAGEWDSKRRESYVRIDRVLAVTEGAVRREGSSMTIEQYTVVYEAFAKRGTG